MSLFGKKICFILFTVLISGTALNSDPASPVQEPEENRFKKVTLLRKLFNPMELEISPDGDIYLIEANGRLSRVNPETSAVTLLGIIKGHDSSEYGLIGMALDPGFEQNHWIYVQYFLPQKDKIAQVSRFTIVNNSLDLLSEKKYVQVPYNETCCHAGGSMSFDSKGNLYFSTGDNSDAFQYIYAPVDERPGHEFVNSLRSAANTMDLRGKICRIHPENDGTYSIPEGNLFPDNKNARPEIYIMGLRNPYRIFVDKRTDVLYWGEVGPDARRDSTQGPIGFDEFNIARKAGNYGWPMFSGNSQAYAPADFTSGKIGERFDLAHPLNNSRLNTGLKELPEAKEATIWYPYKGSEEFPELGEGARAAIGGPVYHYDPNMKSAIRFPEYYNNKWFISDWIRCWIKAVTLDDQYKTQKIEAFMSSSRFSKPMDMAFSPKDGALYMLEYGDAWDANDEAALVRIEYTNGNRAPVAIIESDKLSGRIPLAVSLSAKKSYDNDQDDLKYVWTIDDVKKITGRDVQYTFTKNGIHQVSLTVSDPSRHSHTEIQLIHVGNSLPQLSIDLLNHTFYSDSLTYNVNVTDAEDGKIGKGVSPQAVKVSLSYQPKISVLTKNASGVLVDHGEVLLNESDCKSCHKIDGTSVGPSFTDIAARYLPEVKSDDKVVDQLADKILNGGGGVWFKDRAMAPHPQLTREQATETVRYILSLGLKNNPAKTIPLSGTIVLNENPAKPKIGFYTLTASYTDRGANTITPLTSSVTEVLRAPQINGEDFDELYNQPVKNHFLIGLTNSYGVIRNIDLTNIKEVTMKVKAIAGAFEMHLDSLTGRQVGSFPINNNARNRSMEVTSALLPVKGKHDLYLLYRNSNDQVNPMQLEWLYFKLE